MYETDTFVIVTRFFSKYFLASKKTSSDPVPPYIPRKKALLRIAFESFA